jgi:hypothetical protein
MDVFSFPLQNLDATAATRIWDEAIAPFLTQRLLRRDGRDRSQTRCPTCAPPALLLLAKLDPDPTNLGPAFAVRVRYPYEFAGPGVVGFVTPKGESLVVPVRFLDRSSYN